jgi:hypothetical protein
MGALLAPQFCRIERWHGYVTSSLYARLPDGTVLESPSFRWRHRAPPPPDDGPARAAYDELVGRLEAAGWTRDADGVDWFATAFTRLVESHEEIGLHRHAELVPTQLPSAPIVAPPVPTAAPPVEPAPAPPNIVLPAAHEQRPVERPAKPVSDRRRLPIVAAGAVLIAAALVSATLLLGHNGKAKPVAAQQAPRQVLRIQPTTSRAAARVTKSVAEVAAPVGSVLVDVRIAAHGNGSWLEVRRTSATGAVLYRATLTDGRTLHFRAPKLWARFGAASNLTITSNGQPVRLQGTYDKLFLPAHS